MRDAVLRQRFLSLLEDSEPLNTSQICRLINGAKHKHDIDFCTSGIKDKFTDEKNFAKHGNHTYRNCIACSINWKQIYYQLSILEKKRFLESRVEWRQDPIVIGRKDKFRMWAHRGKLPSLIPFLEMAEIATKEEH